jgi:hypothetical protein
MKRFNEFLNESTKKRFQYSISKDILDDFENELNKKSNEMDINFTINKIKGLSQIKILLTFNGDENNIKNLIDWIKENY